jgi:hypothetical protein
MNLGLVYQSLLGLQQVMLLVMLLGLQQEKLLELLELLQMEVQKQFLQHPNH